MRNYLLILIALIDHYYFLLLHATFHMITEQTLVLSLRMFKFKEMSSKVCTLKEWIDRIIFGFCHNLIMVRSSRNWSKIGTDDCLQVHEDTTRKDEDFIIDLAVPLTTLCLALSRFSLIMSWHSTIAQPHQECCWSTPWRQHIAFDCGVCIVVAGQWI